ADVLERVVAVVDDTPIFLSALRRRALPLLPRLAQLPPERRGAELENLYRRILELLIDEELVQRAARTLQVRVTTADVERALDNVRAQNQLSPEEFWQAVSSQGYTEASYRADLRQQLLRLKVLNQRVRTRVNITESDVRRRYDQELRNANRELRFEASQIFFPVPTGATATELRAVRAEAEAVAAEAVDEDTFAELADEYGGGSLGWLRQGDLPEVLETVLLGLGEGEVSEPVRSVRGYHVFLLHGRERGGDGLPPFDAVKEQIFQQMMAQAMDRQERLFLEELRRDAIIDIRL
ncbi:MAG: SurA N-terminal domain-containing protein, partial [Myxococcota bacterium]